MDPCCSSTSFSNVYYVICLLWQLNLIVGEFRITEKSLVINWIMQYLLNCEFSSLHWELKSQDSVFFLFVFLTHRHYVAQRRPSKCQDEGTEEHYHEVRARLSLMHSTCHLSDPGLDEAHKRPLSHSHKHLTVYIKCFERR